MTDQSSNNEGQELSPQNNITAEQYVAQHQEIAARLNASKDMDEAFTTLEPLQALTEEEQISFLKELGKQNTIEAADIAQALYTLSDNKAVRKEARRRLVQFENNNIYSEWTPPASQALTQTIGQLAAQGETTEGDLIAQFQSLFEGNSDLLGGPEYITVVENFLEDWTDGDYGDAIEYLASDSPLREGLTDEAWVASREQWAETAHPSDLRITFIDPVQDENGQDLPIIDVGWSVCITDLPENSLAELPLTTLLFKETGRRWFWTRYTVVQDEDEWFIQTMSDEAAQAFQLPREVLEQRLEEITAKLDEYQMDEIVEEDEDDDLADEEVKIEVEREVVVVENDEEDEDDEDDEAELAEIFGNMGATLRLSVQSLHYTDALIAQTPQENAEIYEHAFNLAGTLNEAERAAVYAQQLAEHIPSERGLALRNLAYTYLLLANQSHNNDDHEQEEHFESLVEPIAREAVAADNSPQNLILLASLLIQEEKDLEEAESYLRQAEKGPLSDDDTIEIESGLADIALQKEDAELALHHFQNLTHLAPDDGMVWFRVGFLQDQLHHPKEAIEAYLKSIEITPDFTESYKGLAEVYIEQDSLPKARDIIRQGIEENTDAADLQAALAMIYLQSGDIRSAERYLRLAEEIDDEDEFVQAARESFNEMKKHQPSQSGSKGHKGHQHKKKR